MTRWRETNQKKWHYFCSRRWFCLEKPRPYNQVGRGRVFKRPSNHLSLFEWPLTKNKPNMVLDLYSCSKMLHCQEHWSVFIFFFLLMFSIEGHLSPFLQCNILQTALMMPSCTSSVRLPWHNDWSEALKDKSSSKALWLNDFNVTDFFYGTDFCVTIILHLAVCAVCEPHWPLC